MLLTSIMLLCLLFLLMSDLIKLLKIPLWVQKRNAKQSAVLQSNLDSAMDYYRSIKEMEIKDSYSYHIKLLRAEEAVNEMRKKQRTQQNIAQLKSQSAEVILTYCGKGIVALILFIISVRNRYTPVVVLDERLNFQPLTGIMSFPTGVANAVSIPMWVLSCNVTFNYIYKLIRSKK